MRVLLVEPGEPELAARIEGQPRDRAVAMERVSAEPGLDATGAKALAIERNARAVVSVQAQPDGSLRVRVFDVLLGSERSRQVPKPEGEPLGSSAVFEAAALAVRGELSSLLSKDAETNAEAPPPAVQTLPPAPPPGSPELEPPSTAADIDAANAARAVYSLRIGGRFSHIAAPHYTGGPTLGLGLELGALVLGLHATTALPITVRGDAVSVALRRHGVGMRASVIALSGPRARVLLGADAGLVLYARSTEGTTGLRATPDATSVSGTFGASTELQWLPSRVVGAALTLGVDALPWPTRFAIKRSSGQVTLERLSWYEPWVELSLLLRFGSGPPDQGGGP